MSKKRLVDVEHGVATYHMYDEDNDKTIIQTVQDVEPLLDSNQKKINEAGKGWKGDFHHVASIPLVIYEQWWAEFGGDPLAPENKARTIAKLNNKDWCKLRTKEGRI